MCSHKQLENICVLAVDDDQATLQVLCTILEREAASVVAVDSAQAALAILLIAQPDVLLSDIGMPDMDGYQFIVRLRQNGVTVPALAITSYSGHADRERALRCGFQGHMAKPTSANELIAAVQQLCVPHEP